MTAKLKVLDLFSGIGGFSLGLERTGGFETVAFCEIEEYPRQVLAKHWPKVPCYHDVRELTADALARDGIAVDVICGGFPCQDISFAGKGAGLAGERSGLWSQYSRLIGELRPKFVLVENVAALLSRGLADVLGDLAALGYDAEWHCIPASAVGAPHRRDRLWIVAYAARNVQPEQEARRPQRKRARTSGEPISLADADSPSRTPEVMPVAGARCEEVEAGSEKSGRRRSIICHANVSGLALREGKPSDDVEKFAPAVGTDWWLVEPDVGRVAHGVPSRVDRLRCLGNAVVPQIPELIGRAILQSMTPAEAERARCTI